MPFHDFRRETLEGLPFRNLERSLEGEGSELGFSRKVDTVSNLVRSVMPKRVTGLFGGNGPLGRWSNSITTGRRLARVPNSDGSCGRAHDSNLFSALWASCGYDTPIIGASIFHGREWWTALSRPMTDV